MEGTRHLVFMKPVAGGFDSAGQEMEPSYDEIVVYGTRNDRAGIETTRLETSVSIARTVWRVRSAGIEDVNASWKLRDDRGQECNITHVAESVGSFQRGEFYDVFCDAVSV